MKTAFLLEDDPFQRRDIIKFLKEEGINVIEAKDKITAMKVLDDFINSDTYPDINIFDYLMEEGADYTGIDIAKKFFEVYKVPTLLFTLLRYDTEVMDGAKQLEIPAEYLLAKELLNSRQGVNNFLEIVRLAVKNSEEAKKIRKYKGGEKIIIRDGNKDDYYIIEYDSILYLKARGAACEIFFKNRNSHTFGANLGTIAPQIARRTDDSFTDVGQSYYFNLNNILRYSQQTIYFKPDGQNPLGVKRGEYDTLKQKFDEFIIKTIRGSI